MKDEYDFSQAVQNPYPQAVSLKDALVSSHMLDEVTEADLESFSAKLDDITRYSNGDFIPRLIGKYEIDIAKVSTNITEYLTRLHNACDDSITGKALREALRLSGLERKFNEVNQEICKCILAVVFASRQIIDKEEGGNND